MKTMKRFYTLFAILLILSISIHVGPVQNAVAAEADWMPDANLRTAVRENLGLANGVALTQAKMLDLTSLHAPRAGISNLTGLEHATNLTSLVAFQNQVSSLTPLENLTSLTDLRMGNNDISDVTPLDDLTSLTRLGLQKNNISNVTPLAGLVNLTWLRLAGNSITDLSPLVTLVNVTNSDVDLPEPDTTAPGVSISVPSGTQTGAFNVTITFTETVSDFVQSEVSLSGSAASITRWSANSGNTVYTATITPTASGTVTIGVAANVATDAANNQNTAATSKTVSVDVDAPGVSVSVLSDKQTDTFDATITFTEAVSGFEQPDLSLTGTANASTTAWSTTGNTTYIATITPTTEGTVIINVPANVATDTAGNNNSAGTAQIVTVKFKDTEAPTVSISAPASVQNSAFSVSFIFSEAVSVFEEDEVSLTGTANTTITAWNTTDNTTYTATITPTTSGTVIINVPAGIAADAARNPNTAATSQTVHVDVDSPTVSITVPSDEQSSEFNAIITFSETVSGFAQSDVSLSGSAASITGWSASSGNTVYTATITPTASGTVTVGVAANVATDAANNSNTVATSKTVTVSIPVLVSIPDAALAALVRTELSLAANAAITTADMRRLTSLGGGSARRLGISNLTGLEHATNLGSLTLPRNSISDLSPLTNLTSLRSLSLSRNSISNLVPLQNLTELTSLGLKQNNISDLSPLSGLTKLNSLVLKNNNFTDVSPLGDLVAEDGTTNLVTLLLEHNSIANTAANATALQALSDAGTNIDIAIPDVDVNAAPLASGNIPDETLLHPNYPNPFNPETWIPYHLANDSDVQISIYDINGALVRQLDLGHQGAGYYASRSRAAYWDGRNEFGERVATGIYFYQLKADNMSLIRKMVILK